MCNRCQLLVQPHGSEEPTRGRCEVLDNFPSTSAAEYKQHQAELCFQHVPNAAIPTATLLQGGFSHHLMAQGNPALLFWTGELPHRHSAAFSQVIYMLKLQGVSQKLHLLQKAKTKRKTLKSLQKQVKLISSTGKMFSNTFFFWPLANNRVLLQRQQRLTVSCTLIIRDYISKSQPI